MRPIGREPDDSGEDEQQDAVDLRAQDLAALEAERERPFGRPAREAQGDQGQADRAGVGEHVRRVGEQRERVGDQADDDLDDHEAEVDQQREQQPARVAAGADAVRVRGPRCRDRGRGRPWPGCAVGSPSARGVVPARGAVHDPSGPGRRAPGPGTCWSCPGRPLGRPAVMPTRWPARHQPSSTTRRAASAISSSVTSCLRIDAARTPHIRPQRRTVSLPGESARIGTVGRCAETRRAERPDSVGTTSASSSSSRAASTTLWAIV